MARKREPLGGPGCYRVMLRGGRGVVWGPIVDAVDEDEAKAKAVHLFPHADPVSATFLHQDGRHKPGEVATLGDLLDAKINQANLVRVGRQGSSGGFPIGVIERRRHVA